MPPEPAPEPRCLVIMGVSGSGKTTVGRGLAARLGWDFEEGDTLHPAANVAKMKSGHPLTDEDRWPWLERIGDWIDAQHVRGRGSVVTCSALKWAYRDLLDRGRPQVRFVHLAGTRAAIAERVAHREHAYMPASLLDSQFADLEPLQPDEPGIEVDVLRPPDEVVADVLCRLDLG